MGALAMRWRANGRVTVISSEISHVFSGIRFVITPDAAVRATPASGYPGGCGWRDAARSQGARLVPMGCGARNGAGDAPALGFSFARIDRSETAHHAALRRSVASRPSRRIFTGC